MSVEFEPIEKWHAMRFIKVMEEGKCHPLLLDVNRSPAGSSTSCEAVVKQTGNNNVTPDSMFREIYGNRIATIFGVVTPKPLLVTISVEASKAFSGDCGLSVDSGTFVGTVHLGPQLVPVPNPFLPTGSILTEDAVKILAFDYLTQNPDRREHKPNSMILRDRLVAFDFEHCFSFIELIIPEPEPWKQSKHPSYNRTDRRHVFAGLVSGGVGRFTYFRDRLRSLSPDLLRAAAVGIPTDWTSRLDRVINHLLTVRDHADEFIRDMERSLM